MTSKWRLGKQTSQLSRCVTRRDLQNTDECKNWKAPSERGEMDKTYNCVKQEADGGE